MLLILDAATHSLYRSRVSLQEIKPNGDLQRVAINTSLDAPTDVVSLGSKRIAIADRGRVLVCVRDGDAYRVEWISDNASGSRFGDVLHIGADRDVLLVSDRDRHRLVWLDWSRRSVVAQYGVTGNAGTDLRHLRSPTYVSVRGGRAVVADAGNQRVLKLELHP
jgi:hypothetical protein